MCRVAQPMSRTRCGSRSCSSTDWSDPASHRPVRFGCCATWTRHGRRLTEEHTRTIQRWQKVLHDAGIKLTSVASTILGKTGRAILAALLAARKIPPC